MNRCSFCAWIPILPWPVWPLAGHARLGQNTVVGSMTIRLSGLCWGAYQEEVCLDPRFLCNLTLPRFSAELRAVQAPPTIALSGFARDGRVQRGIQDHLGLLKCRQLIKVAQELKGVSHLLHT